MEQVLRLGWVWFNGRWHHVRVLEEGPTEARIEYVEPAPQRNEAFPKQIGVEKVLRNPPNGAV